MTHEKNWVRTPRGKNPAPLAARYRDNPWGRMNDPVMAYTSIGVQGGTGRENGKENCDGFSRHGY